MSIRLTTKSRVAVTSSKGNQEKWLENGRWCKLDQFGYEGLAETVTSSLLAKTNVDLLGFRYVTYRTERLEVHREPGTAVPAKISCCPANPSSRWLTFSGGVWGRTGSGR